MREHRKQTRQQISEATMHPKPTLGKRRKRSKLNTPEAREGTTVEAGRHKLEGSRHKDRPKTERSQMARSRRGWIKLGDWQQS